MGNRQRPIATETQVPRRRSTALIVIQHHVSLTLLVLLRTRSRAEPARTRRAWIAQQAPRPEITAGKVMSRSRRSSHGLRQAM